MAKINQDELKEIRKNYIEVANETAETTEAILELSNQVKKEAQNMIQDFTKSKYALSKVTYRVVNEHISAMAGLKDIHTALHKLQELTEHFRAILIPKNVEFFNDCKVIWDDLQSDFMGDLDVISTLTTNVDKERELYYIFRGALNAWSYMGVNNQQMDSYEKYLTNQMFGFNRLDTLVQKLENIKANELFGDLNDDSRMNKDEDDKGFIDLDEDGFESMKSNRKRRVKRKPLGKRLEKVK